MFEPVYKVHLVITTTGTGFAFGQIFGGKPLGENLWGKTFGGKPLEENLWGQRKVMVLKKTKTFPQF